MRIIFIVIKCECTELNFCDPTILGVFETLKAAEDCKKNHIINISDNLKVNIIKSFIQTESPYKDIPIDVLNGYTVA